MRHRIPKYKEITTLKRNLKKEEIVIEKGLTKLQKKIFYSKEEAERDVADQKKYHPNFKFSHKIKGLYEHVTGIKRKIRIGYTVEITFKKDEDRIKKCEMRKGKFILTTNNLNYDDLSAREILKVYRSRNDNVEGCFKFILRVFLDLMQECI